MGKILLALGGINLFLAVGLGAFGAHALRGRLESLPLDRSLAIWETAVQYHMVHALGLLAIGLSLHWLGSDWLRWSGLLALAGILLFCGSLYLMSVTGWRFLGPITPLGGLCFLAAWVCFTVGVLK